MLKVWLQKWTLQHKAPRWRAYLLVSTVRLRRCAFITLYPAWNQTSIWQLKFSRVRGRTAANRRSKDTTVLFSFQASFESLDQVSGLNLRVFLLSFLLLLEERLDLLSVLSAIFNDDIWGSFPFSTAGGGQARANTRLSINKWIINYVNPVNAKP